MKEGTMDFTAIKYANVSPLARNLFLIDGVNRVFYGKDYISVSKAEKFDWNELKPKVYAVIMDHFVKEEPVFIDEIEHEDTKINEDDSEVVQLIKEILDTRVRPTV